MKIFLFLPVDRDLRFVFFALAGRWRLFRRDTGLAGSRTGRFGFARRLLALASGRLAVRLVVRFAILGDGHSSPLIPAFYAGEIIRRSTRVRDGRLLSLGGGSFSSHVTLHPAPGFSP